MIPVFLPSLESLFIKELQAHEKTEKSGLGVKGHGRYKDCLESKFGAQAMEGF